ncbi:lactonase family protein [Paucilactobacillus suebicus]|uniref:3-carboxymuconate cyclase n=1 Tax=Paucilactobacillus suebicus DSM 5007 = KCTC 3549 TaxID=1423807 RepID=A0A0R1W8E7_9LACO|nr:lactonase family protein [Paucilactobacillus suebicus]KRM12148.1 3-carboxymuconate cyclase [Paucilactobacillus suebicus DSM 5007 = KCTC 3549]
MFEKVLLGGYTHKNGEGVYVASFDSKTGHLTTPSAYIKKIGSPTYLAVSKDNYAYLIDDHADQSGVAAYELNSEEPRLINENIKVGTSPAHVMLDEQRQLIFASNYHMGKINVYRINQDKTISEIDEVVHQGNGPRPEQESSHVHFTALTPDRRVVAVDLGNDTLTTYDVTEEGKLKLVQTLELPDGYGPRHLVFNEKEPIAYLLGELSSQVSALKYNESDGSFSLVSSVSTIPTTWTAHNGAAAIRISNDQRFLYVSNRGFNSVTVFAINRDGLKLTEIQQISSEGDFPRDFNLDLTNNFILLVNQNTSNGTIYKRNSENGKLTLVEKNIVTPECVNVLFLKR